MSAPLVSVARRRAALPYVRGEELDDIAMQAANDALAAVLRKLDSYRGESRFTTWAYKFALLEAGVRLRRRVWQEREVVLDDQGWMGIAGRHERARGARRCPRETTRRLLTKACQPMGTGATT